MDKKITLIYLRAKAEKEWICLTANVSERAASVARVKIQWIKKITLI